MRIRTQLIIPDDVLAKIDEIAGEKHRRAIVVETALREYIDREESKPKKKVVAAGKTTAKKH
jgi:metal-responsive CopG/Arc/MetJ family transcriptional regulator